MSGIVDPVELSNRIIDTGNPEPPHNRVLDELVEVEDEVAVVESFSHCWAVKTQEGLVCVDASGTGSGENVVKALRDWSKNRFILLCIHMAILTMLVEVELLWKTLKHARKKNL